MMSGTTYDVLGMVNGQNIASRRKPIIKSLYAEAGSECNLPPKCCSLGIVIGLRERSLVVDAFACDGDVVRLGD
jgi:hypothetical protein